MLATSAFAGLAANVAESSGMPNAKVVIIPHPLGGIGADTVKDKVAGVVDQVIEMLTAIG